MGERLSQGCPPLVSRETQGMWLFAHTHSHTDKYTPIIPIHPSASSTSHTPLLPSVTHTHTHPAAVLITLQPSNHLWPLNSVSLELKSCFPWRLSISQTVALKIINILHMPTRVSPIFRFFIAKFTKQSNRLKQLWTDRQTDRRTDEWTDGQMDGQRDRQKIVKLQSWTKRNYNSHDTISGWRSETAWTDRVNILNGSWKEKHMQ